MYRYPLYIIGLLVLISDVASEATTTVVPSPTDATIPSQSIQIDSKDFKLNIKVPQANNIDTSDNIPSVHSIEGSSHSNRASMHSSENNPNTLSESMHTTETSMHSDEINQNPISESMHTNGGTDAFVKMEQIEIQPDRVQPLITPTPLIVPENHVTDTTNDKSFLKSSEDSTNKPSNNVEATSAVKQRAENIHHDRIKLQTVQPVKRTAPMMQQIFPAPQLDAIKVASNVPPLFDIYNSSSPSHILLVVGDVSELSTRILVDDYRQTANDPLRIFVEAENESVNSKKSKHTEGSIEWERLFQFTLPHGFARDFPQVIALYDLQPQRTYKVVFKYNDGIEFVQFRTMPIPGDTLNDQTLHNNQEIQPIRIPVVSCNRYIDDNDDGFLAYLAEREKDRTAMFHIGDQLYNDIVAKHILESHREYTFGEMLTFFRQAYRWNWNHPSIRKILHTRANFMIPDDHDIVNNLDTWMTGRIDPPTAILRVLKLKLKHKITHALKQFQTWFSHTNSVNTTTHTHNPNTQQTDTIQQNNSKTDQTKKLRLHEACEKLTTEALHIQHYFAGINTLCSLVAAGRQAAYEYQHQLVADIAQGLTARVYVPSTTNKENNHNDQWRYSDSSLQTVPQQPSAESVLKSDTLQSDSSFTLPTLPSSINIPLLPSIRSESNNQINMYQQMKYPEWYFARTIGRTGYLFLDTRWERTFTSTIDAIESLTDTLNQQTECIDASCTHDSIDDTQETSTDIDDPYFLSDTQLEFVQKSLDHWDSHSEIDQIVILSSVPLVWMEEKLAIFTEFMENDRYTAHTTLRNHTLRLLDILASSAKTSLIVGGDVHLYSHQTICRPSHSDRPERCFTQLVSSGVTFNSSTIFRTPITLFDILIRNVFGSSIGEWKAPFHDVYLGNAYVVLVNTPNITTMRDSTGQQAVENQTNNSSNRHPPTDTSSVPDPTGTSSPTTIQNEMDSTLSVYNQIDNAPIHCISLHTDQCVNIREQWGTQAICQDPTVGDFCQVNSMNWLRSSGTTASLHKYNVITKDGNDLAVSLHSIDIPATWWQSFWESFSRFNGGIIWGIISRPDIHTIDTDRVKTENQKSLYDVNTNTEQSFVFEAVLRPLPSQPFLRILHYLFDTCPIILVTFPILLLLGVFIGSIYFICFVVGKLCHLCYRIHTNAFTKQQQQTDRRTIKTVDTQTETIQKLSQRKSMSSSVNTTPSPNRNRKLNRMPSPNHMSGPNRTPSRNPTPKDQRRPLSKTKKSSDPRTSSISIRRRRSYTKK